MGKVTDFFRRLLHYPIKKKEVVHEHKRGSEQQRAPREELLFDRPLVVRRPGDQATKQDIGKFMRHGRQLPHYRKSVKAKVKPEEEN